MGVLANIVPQAQPALFGGGCSAEVTAGATWRFKFLITDVDGTNLNLSSGVTGTCSILSAVGGSVLASPTFAGANGSFTVVLDESLTGALAGPSPVQARWLLSITDSTDVVEVWGPFQSHLIIYPAA